MGWRSEEEAELLERFKFMRLTLMVSPQESFEASSEVTEEDFEQEDVEGKDI